MRKKIGGVLLAVAMVLPIGLAASPAAAAGGTKCKSNTGTSTFKPALPIVSSKKTVNSTTTGTGKITGCAGGGVASATFKSVFTYKAYNCTKLLSYNPKPQVGTITTTWSNHKTSTGSLVLHAIKGNLTKVNVTGTVTKGQFVGLKLTTSFTFALVTKNGCTKVPLAKVSIKSASPIVIK